MNLITAAFLLVIVLLSAAFVSTNILDTVAMGREFSEYNRAKNIMRTLDSEINAMLAESQNSKQIYMDFRKGAFEISGEHDTVRYVMEIETAFETSSEGSLVIIPTNKTVELLLNYSGIIDISGNISRTGSFVLNLEKDDTHIIVR